MKKCILISGLITIAIVLFFIIKPQKDVYDDQNTESESTVVEEDIDKIDILNEESDSVDSKVTAAKDSGKAMIVITDVQGKAGDLVNVDVELVNNPGILGMDLTLSFDEKVLKLKKVEQGAGFSDILNLTCSKELKDGCNFLWDGESISQEQIKDGKLVRLYFEILKNIKKTKTPICLIPETDGIVNNDLETVEVEFENGYVTIL